jgi:hypothetical protein
MSAIMFFARHSTSSTKNNNPLRIPDKSFYRRLRVVSRLGAGLIVRLNGGQECPPSFKRWRFWLGCEGFAIGFFGFVLWRVFLAGVSFRSRQ